VELLNDFSGDQELLSSNSSLKKTQMAMGRKYQLVGIENQKFCQQHSCLKGTRITSQRSISPVRDYLQDGNMPRGGGDSHIGGSASKGPPRVLLRYLFKLIEI